MECELIQNGNFVAFGVWLLFIKLILESSGQVYVKNLKIMIVFVNLLLSSSPGRGNFTPSRSSTGVWILLLKCEGIVFATRSLIVIIWSAEIEAWRCWCLLWNSKWVCVWCCRKIIVVVARCCCVSSKLKGRWVVIIVVTRRRTTELKWRWIRWLIVIVLCLSELKWIGWGRCWSSAAEVECWRRCDTKSFKFSKILFSQNLNSFLWNFL